MAKREEATARLETAGPGGLRFLSVCSGVEAASLAWGPLGWKAAAFAQFDPEHNYARGPDFPSRVLAHRFPDVPNLRDLTRYEEWPADLAPDVLAGGTPCQSFSVAGRRGGMADSRGQLSYCFVGVARRYRPRWVIWENVPGAYSADKGEAFRSIVGALEELGYGLAWRVRDAQFFGVPQRRRRIVLVGYLGDWRPAAAVLFEPGSVQRNHSTRGKARAGVAGPNGLGLADGGGPVGTLGCAARAPGPDEAVAGHIIPAVTSKWAKGSGVPAGDECQNLIVFDPTQITSPENRSGCEPGAPSHALASNARPPHIAGPLAFTSKDHGQDAGQIAPTLRGMGHGASHANAGGQVAIAFNARQDPISGGVCGPLDTAGSTNAVAFNLRGREDGAQPEMDKDGLASIRAASGGSSRSYVGDGVMVRRLTPRECERLQGMPDDWTRIPIRHHKATPTTKHFRDYRDHYEPTLDGGWIQHAPDGPRYKAIGNSWAVPVFRWLGERVMLVESVMAELAATERFAVEETDVGPQLTIFPPAALAPVSRAPAADDAPALAAIAKASGLQSAPAQQRDLFGDLAPPVPAKPAGVGRVRRAAGLTAASEAKGPPAKPSGEMAAPPETGIKRASFEASLGSRRIKRPQRIMGSIGQGAAPASERGLDLYESDPNAVRALAREWAPLQRPRLVWEPACGPGVIVRALREAGHLVIATDVEDYGPRMPERAAVQDFFAFDSAPEGADLVVTNPPYLHADAFVEHALKLAPTCAMLLRLAYVQGIARSRIVDRHLSELLIFRDRLAMMHRDGFEGPKITSSAIPFAWFVFERDHPTPGEWRSRRIWAQPEKAWKAEKAAGGIAR